MNELKLTGEEITLLRLMEKSSDKVGSTFKYWLAQYAPQMLVVAFALVNKKPYLLLLPIVMELSFNSYRIFAKRRFIKIQKVLAKKILLHRSQEETGTTCCET